MDGIICLTESQRKTALEHFRFGDSARISRSAHGSLLDDANHDRDDAIGTDVYRFHSQVRVTHLFDRPSNRCRSERGFRPRTPTASRSTRSPSLIKHRGPSCQLPQREAMAALSMPRLFGHARGFYVTASAQAECFHSTCLFGDN